MISKKELNTLKNTDYRLTIENLRNKRDKLTASLEKVECATASVSLLSIAGCLTLSFTDNKNLFDILGMVSICSLTTLYGEVIASKIIDKQYSNEIISSLKEKIKVKENC